MTRLDLANEIKIKRCQIMHVQATTFLDDWRTWNLVQLQAMANRYDLALRYYKNGLYQTALLIADGWPVETALNMSGEGELA
jgi:hypothetical protein